MTTALSTPDLPRRRIATLLSVALFWIALYLYVPVLSPDVLHRGGTLTVVGLVVAMYGLPQLLFRIPLGTFSDRLGRRRPFVLLGFAFVVISSLGMGVLQTPDSFALFRFAAGVGAATWVILSVAYAGLFEQSELQQAMGWLMFANSGGMLIASLLGGEVAQLWGWRAPFLLAALVAIAGLLLAIRLPEMQSPAKPGRALKDFQQVLQAAPLRLAALLGIAGQVVSSVTVFGYIPVLGAELGLGRADFGLLTVASLLPTTIVQGLTGPVLGKILSPRYLLLLGYAVMAIGGALLIGKSVPWELFLAEALIGIGRGLTSPTLMTLAITGSAERLRGSAMAVYQAVYSLGMVGGPALAGWLSAAHGLPVVFSLATAAALLGTGLMALPTGALAMAASAHEERPNQRANTSTSR